MIEPRTVTVNVLVAKSLEVDEPGWCLGHRDDRAQSKADIEHNGSETFATFDGPHGPIEYLRAWITQRPYANLAPEPLPLVAVEINGEIVSLTPDDVHAFTSLTRAHLAFLDGLADEADAIRQETR
ncbi:MULTISPECIES: DUF6907 domain-containing protein [Streptomyces]|uniref:Uncharacterized protein n=1 Tax=Streptomyces dengpaensis TaxID=2049881 RepID=A0ABN5I964_9ACTN|nr:MULTISPECIES: hypothetical protein [Streptomyces]AVH59712.1 hypothetical protein C4B68_32610 [Streptomyces dengpaensis]PIB09356.1 hypothetical protein B1C81_09290 [Streptomyces sp. HG99]